MKVIRKNKIVRSDPEANPNGTPLVKTPEAELGTSVIPKERYTSKEFMQKEWDGIWSCLLYTSPSPRDRTRSRMPSSA